MEGRVKFLYVDILGDAAFEAQYKSGGIRCLLATAFFPADYYHDLNFICVSRSVFSRSYRRSRLLYATMLHELGHVIGLRHNFAYEKCEQRAESILFGVENPNSIMSYGP